MKLMVSALLLVATSHAAEVSRSRQEEEEGTVKRELLEGNFGMKIQPLASAFSNPQGVYGGNKNGLYKGTPQKEYGPPRQSVAKISDVLAGQGTSFPAAIQSHLYSPVRIYPPTLGSPTTFEVSQPVPSQLAYSEHKVYQEAQNLQRLNENLQALNQNQPTPRPEQSPVQINPFSGFTEFQLPREHQAVLSNEFLPHVETQSLIQTPEFSQQIYQQVFSQQPGSPQDMVHQINDLGNQITYEETIQVSQGPNDEERRNNEAGNGEQQQQTPGIQYASSTQSSQEQGQKIEDENRELQAQSSTQQSTTAQPQAVSYASFSQSLPVSTQSQNQEQEQQSSSPQTPPQQQELPQSQPPQVFQPLESTQAQSTFESIGTTPTPQVTHYTVANQTPHRVAVYRVRQRVTTPQPSTSSTFEPQGSSASSVTIIDDSDDSPTTQQQYQTSRFSTPSPPQSRPSFRRPTFPTQAPRTTSQSSTFQSQSTFTPRPTFRSLPRQRQRTTSQTFSTFPSSTFSPQTVITQSLPTLPPQPAVQSFPILPPATPQSILIQSTLAPLPLFQPQQIQSVSTQPQFISTPQPLQQVTTPQPTFVTQSPSLSTSSQPGASIIGPIPDQRQQYQIQSEPRSAFQTQEQAVQNSQQLLQPSQLQFIQDSQQIQEQLRLIQQQLQYIQQQQQQQQQQPQLFQQQPQPVQIFQQQSQPQPIQPIPQSTQPLEQPQLIPAQQVVQSTPIPQTQQPQLSIPQPQLPIPQPQLPIPQPQLPIQQPQLILQQPILPPLQPVPLIQQQPQLIQQQPLLIQQQPQLIQQQPPLIQQQPQLIQQQPQPTQPTQQQQQPAEPSPQPQAESRQNSQQDQQKNQEKEQQKQNSEKQETESSPRPNVEVDYYAQLLNNNLYSDELYIQPQHLHPVPVAFTSFDSPSLPSVYPPPHFQGHSYQHGSSFPSVQYYGKYAPNIFGSWR